MNGLGVDLLHPQLGDDVVLRPSAAVDHVVVGVRLRVGGVDAAPTAGRRQDRVAVVADGRDARQTADSLAMWTEQASDVVEILVVMTWPVNNNYLLCPMQPSVL